MIRSCLLECTRYTGLQDSYLSVLKALKHSVVSARRALVVDWVSAQALEDAESDKFVVARCGSLWLVLALSTVVHIMF